MVGWLTEHGLIHIANVIYLASYAVKDIRALRWLTIIGIVLLIPYYLCWQLWAAAIWNAVFLGINLYRLSISKPSPHAVPDNEKVCGPNRALVLAGRLSQTWSSKRRSISQHSEQRVW